MSTAFSYGPSVLMVRLPPVREVLSLWMRAHLKDAQIVDILRTAEVRRLVTDSVGHGINGARAREIVASTTGYQAYREARHAELVEATEGGAITAECPHCGRWRAELAPLAVAVLLRSPFRPVVDAWGDPAVPSAADSGWRLAPDHASGRLWLTLPSRPDERLPFGDPGERARLARWQARSAEFFTASAGTELPEVDRPDWSPDSPGWVALLRLVSAVPGLVSESDDYPHADEDAATAVARALAAARIPLADLLFADNVTWLTRVAPVAAVAADLSIKCGGCDGEFLPLGTSPDWSDFSADVESADVESADVETADVQRPADGTTAPR